MPTIKDVAKKANVGIATVSRVINNSGFVSAETRAIVEQAISDLDYVPNELARNFQKSKSNVVAVLVPDISQKFTVTLVKEIEFYLQSKGYLMMVGSSERDESLELEYIEKLKAQQVAGLIITAPLSQNFNNVNFPLVSFDRKINDEIPFVYTSNYKGGMKLTNVLIDKGCNKIAYVDFNPDKKSLANRRVLAVKDICKKEQIEYNTYVFDNKKYKEYYDFLSDIFSQLKEHDGIVFSCDQLARVFCSLCYKHNVRVPDDIQFVSFDGLKSNSIYYPILTTVGHDYPMIAKTLVDIVFQQMNKSEYKLDNEIPFIYNIGETVKK